MKNILTRLGPAIVLAACFLALNVDGQNLSRIKQSARTAAAGITVSIADGKTTVVYKGKQVWTGKTAGKVTGKAKVVNGVEYAAAFQGNKVIWENQRGAAKHLK